MTTSIQPSATVDKSASPADFEVQGVLSDLQYSSLNRIGSFPYIMDSERQVFSKLYGNNEAEIIRQAVRYENLRTLHDEKFGEMNAPVLFSSPGRAEIGGNHTDHQGGLVLTASVNLDCIATVTPTSDRKITLWSKGYDKPFVVELDSVSEPQGPLKTTENLIRGVLDGFARRGLKVGGLNICMDSEVPGGAGLSSSAAIQLLLGKIVNDTYNNGDVSTIELAKIGKHSENVFWGKKSGLLDQLGCGLGGINFIDFLDNENPLVKPVKFDIFARGYRMLVVDTGGSHSNLDRDYSDIPDEMRSIANSFGYQRLRDLPAAQFKAGEDKLYDQTKDDGTTLWGARRIMRAQHFYRENVRVEQQFEALAGSQLSKFLELVNASGRSSEKRLQNIFSMHETSLQEVSFALQRTKTFFESEPQCVQKAAWRVHGGGFAGTILVICHESQVNDYKADIAKLYKRSDAVHELRIRPVGAVNVSAMIDEAESARRANVG